MLLGTMTDAEIGTRLVNDLHSCQAKMGHCIQDWERLRKKNPRKALFARIYDMKTNGNEYMHIFINSREVRPNIRTFAKVNVGNGFQWWEVFGGGGADVPSRTVAYNFHFFDRYQTRIGVPGDIRHVILRYAKMNEGSIRIFKKGEMVVYAVNEGIILAQNKKERVVYATFVPYDMLKNTQRAAYDRIKPLLDKAGEIHDKAARRGMSAYDINLMIAEANRDMLSDAESFYDLFFQEGVKVEVSEYEPPKGETIYIDPDFAKELEKFKV